MSQLSKVELAAHRLYPSWGNNLANRNDEGALVIPKELEALMEALYKEVKAKKDLLSEKEKQRLLKNKGEGKPIGRPKLELPSIERIREMLAEDKSSLAKVAKELKVNRQTLANRMKEARREEFLARTELLRKSG